MTDDREEHPPFFWNELERRGSAVALIGEDASAIDYASLATMADAAGFKNLDRQLVLLEMENDVASLSAYLGALRAGHAVIVINGGDPDAAQKLQRRFEPTLCWRAGRLTAIDAPRHADLHRDLAVLLSTSGSTGSAKLVRLSAEAVHENARSIAEYLDLSPADRAITSLPPGYSYGLSVLNSHLLAGGSLALTDRSVIDPVFREMMDSASVTSIACVPYTIELLESSGFFSKIPISLRTITQAGGRLAPEKVLKIGRIADEANIRFFIMYGQTEATARIAWLPPHQRDLHPECIGRAIPRGRLWLRDMETGEEHPERGELLYTGPNVMMGYAEHPDDLRRGREVDDLATGDLAERVGSDIFKIVGRRSRFVKIFGLRLALDEIEAQLKATGVDATVTGSDEQIVVAVVGQAPGHVSASDIAARYKLPEDRIAVIALPELPRLANGKVDYRTITDLAWQKRPKSAGKPFEEFEKLLRHLANGQPVDGQASFNTMRTDSLSFVEASILLERALGDLPPDWQTIPLNTLREMAEAVEQKSGIPKVTFSRDTLVRLLAIFSIILGHGLGISNTLFKGGADVMLMLAGYNLARYNGERLYAGETIPVIWDPLRRILPIMVPILIIYSVFVAPLPLYYWTFTHNYHMDSAIPLYWFLSAWIQCTAFMALLFLLPPVRALFKRNEQTASILLIAFAVLMKFASYAWLNPEAYRFREFEQVFYIFMSGWCFYIVKDARARLVLTAVVCVCSSLSWGMFNTHPMLISLSMIYLIFGPRLKLPLPLAHPLQIVTLASLHIYMVGILPALLLWRMGPLHGVKRFLFTGVHFIATLALGIAAWWLLKLLADWWSAKRGRLRDQDQASHDHPAAPLHQEYPLRQATSE